jgi:hypothetical protein
MAAIVLPVKMPASLGKFPRQHAAELVSAPDDRCSMAHSDGFNSKVGLSCAVSSTLRAWGCGCACASCADPLFE